MKSKLFKIPVLFGALMLSMLYACNIRKFIPEDEYLFQGGKVTVIDSVNIENRSELENELQSLLYPKPNKRILGMHPGLHYHFKAQKEKPGFIVRYLNKKIGEEPVYFSSVKVESTEELIENRLQNYGFFQNEIRSSVKKDSTSKTVKTNYTVVVGKPYQLLSYKVEVDSLEKDDSLSIYNEIRNSLSESILKNGSRYDLGAFKAERNRIDLYLKKRGYYNFNSSFIIFQVDTNLNNNKQYNLYIKLKEGVRQKSKVPYIIDKVVVYPNVTNDTSIVQMDTTIIEDVVFLQNNLFFQPKRLRPFVLLKPGQLYDPIRSNFTSQRLSSIGTYKFVNINYLELDSSRVDSLKLRHLIAVISLAPMTKRSMRSEFQLVTKSNNFMGPNLGITYNNRNIFKGGENFSTTGNFGYEKQFGKNNTGSSNLILGISASLIFPRLIFPGNMANLFNYAIPKTKTTIGVDYFRRSNLYTLNSYTASFGYFWNANRFVSHQMDVVKINYLQLGKTSDLFNSILDKNPYLKRSFEQQFLAGLTYSFVYNELSNLQKKSKFNINFNFDIAGNGLGLLGKKQAADTTKSFLGLSYAQYAKGDLAVSYHLDVGKSGNSLVGRVFGGIGIPYGNSQTMPFVKQYFSGGSYSVRAFPIRGLGPGIYEPTEVNKYNFDRSGDIRLEANLEHRFPIISVLKGAFFADAGNIWNLNNSVLGGKFTSDFIRQFGVGAGFGLRIDVQGFVIRFDLAAPLKRPTTDWKFDYKNPIFNFAIGYPF